MFQFQNSALSDEPVQLPDLEKNDFLKLIKSIKANFNVAQIHYLDMEVDPNSTDEFGYKVMGLKSKKKDVEMKSYQVSSFINNEQIQDMGALHGLHLPNMLKGVLEKEDRMGAQKTVMEKMLELGEKSRKSRITGIWKFLLDKFKWDFGTKIKGKSEDQKSKFIVSKIISDAHYIGGKTRRGPGNFVVCSSGISHYIMDHPSFCYTANHEDRITIPSGDINQIGTLGGNLMVFVDPNMRWNDMTVLIGRKTDDSSPGIYLIEYKRELMEYKDMNPGTLEYGNKIILNSRRAIEDVGDSVSDCYLTEKFRWPKKIFWKLYI